MAIIIKILAFISAAVWQPHHPGTANTKSANACRFRAGALQAAILTPLRVWIGPSRIDSSSPLFLLSHSVWLTMLNMRQTQEALLSKRALF